MRAQKQDERTFVLTQVLNDLRSESFLAKDDEGRSAYLHDMKQNYPHLADEIERVYLNALIDKAPAVVGQLRDLFLTKHFQVANDLERQLIFDKLTKEPSISEGPYRLPREAVERVAAQQTVKSLGSPFNVMEAAREVFRSKMFNDFSPEDKQRYIELMLQQPSLVQANINREDVFKAYYEIEANTQAINRITADPLFLVMAKLDPKSVLRTCETTSQFRRLCQNSGLFVALMRTHYPYNFETINPKEQYIAITFGLETTYRMQRTRITADSTDVYWNEFENPIQYGKTQLPQNIPGFELKISDVYSLNQILGHGYVPVSLRHLIGQTYTTVWDYFWKAPPGFGVLPDEVTKLLESGKINRDGVRYGRPKEYIGDYDTEVVFTIEGYPIPPGTKAWALIMEAEDAENQARVFKTKEDLARFFIEDEYLAFERGIIAGFLIVEDPYGDLGFKLTSQDLEGISSLSSQWKTYIQELQLPYPMRPENVYQYILENDHIQSSPEYRHSSWFIRKVTF